MASQQVTLKDIARATGLTTTTVHRALHGKPGVGEATRAEVQRVAGEMGYQFNYIASALKRQDFRIGIALPQPEGDNRYYYTGIWQGVRQQLREVTQFNVLPVEQGYQMALGANGTALQGLLATHESAPLHGVLTMAVEDEAAGQALARFAEKGIPTVLIGSDMHRPHPLCCVKSCDETAGSLAAELLTAFDSAPTPKKVLLVGHFGYLGMRDQHHNAAGFERYMASSAPHIEVLPVYGEDARPVLRNLARILRAEEIYAIYSASARYTILVHGLLAKLGLTGRVKLVGNDLFPESRALLQQGALAAIIDKKIARQSYLAAKALLDYVIKAEKPESDVLQVQPEVVLRSNVL